MRSVWGVPWRCFSKVVSKSRAPKWWQQGWPRERAGSVAEAELLAPLGELLMPGMPVGEMFRSFKSPEGWGGNYLEPDLSAYGLLKNKRAALFVEYDGYYLHGRTEGVERDQLKNAALLAFGPAGSYVIRINHRNKCLMEENVLWVSVNTWRRGDQNALAKVLRNVLEQTVCELQGAFDSRVAEGLLWQVEKEVLFISKSASHFRDAVASMISGSNVEEIHHFLKVEGFEQMEIQRMQASALVGGISIEGKLKPKLRWLLELGLAKSQVAKAVASHPSILGYSIEQNSKPTVQWMLELGLTKTQVGKAVASFPQILGCSIEQNLKPTVQWMLELGLTKTQVGKAVASFPPILGCSIEKKLKPTVQWMLELGLTKTQVAKAVASYPQILGYNIEQNLIPTVHWMLELGLTKSQVAKAAAKSPQILGCSIEQNLKPTVQWMHELGLTKIQVAKAVASFPQILGLSVEQNLKLTVQWMLELGLTKSQVAKAVATNPRLLSYSIEQNLKPTVQWMLKLGLNESQVAKAVATSPILGLSVQQNLNRKVQWLAELGLTKSQVVKVIVDFPQILGLSIEENLASKMKLLKSYFSHTDSAQLLAKWPVILGYSRQRLEKRLTVLSEQNRLGGLISAMSLTEEAFHKRYLFCSERFGSGVMEIPQFRNSRRFRNFELLNLPFPFRTRC
eukprot:Skav222645  [mRNA]  locus=scaffold10:444608:446644:- [translate_table: standard]